MNDDIKILNKKQQRHLFERAQRLIIYYYNFIKYIYIVYALFIRVRIKITLKDHKYYFNLLIHLRLSQLFGNNLK